MLKTVRRFLSVFLLGGLLLFSFSTPVFADNNQNTAEGYDACNNVYSGGSLPAGFCDHERNQDDAIAVVGKVLNTVYFWVAIIAVIFIIIGGVYYMTSRGDPSKVKRGKETVLYSIVGLVITVFAFAITSFVLDAINGTAGSGSSGSGSGSSTSTPVEIESIAVTASKTQLKEGESVQLDVTFNPTNVNTNTALEYESANRNIAIVSLTGKVTAVSAGTTTITVRTRNNKVDEITIVVLPTVKAEKITLQPTTIELEVRKTAYVTATIEPYDTDDKTIYWSSSDSLIASVDRYGKITGKSAGETYIYAKTSNDKTAKVLVKVTDPSEGTSTGPSGGPDNSDRYHIGNALAGMHAKEDGNLSWTQQAVNKKYWGVECDLQYTYGTLYCYHTNLRSTSATFADTMKVCKDGGSKVIIDLKDGSDSSLKALVAYIKENHLENWVVIQTSPTYAKKINNLYGGKLEYWGLIMNSSSTMNDYFNNASSYKELGYTALNFPRLHPDWPLGSETNINRAKSAGYDVAVFSWVNFSNEEVSRYDSYGVKYLMTSYMNQ